MGLLRRSPDNKQGWGEGFIRILGDRVTNQKGTL
jgi:hypothetical protein